MKNSASLLIGGSLTVAVFSLGILFGSYQGSGVSMQEIERIYARAGVSKEDFEENIRPDIEESPMRDAWTAKNYKDLAKIYATFTGE